jgi:hypothetical protein
MLFGTDVFLDERTGEVVFDVDGNLVTITDEDEIFKQHFGNLLRTERGEEVFLPVMGVDYEMIFHYPFMRREDRVRQGIIDALNFDVFPELAEINSISVTSEGQKDDYTVQVNLALTSKVGDQVSLTAGVEL